MAAVAGVLVAVVAVGVAVVVGGWRRGGPDWVWRVRCGWSAWRGGGGGGSARATKLTLLTGPVKRSWRDIMITSSVEARGREDRFDSD